MKELCFDNTDEFHLLGNMGHIISKERIAYLDNIKGFLIILVVLGHVLQYTYSIDCIADRYIYSFHMPLFMCVSGYCSYKATINWDTIRKRAIQLLIPFLSWAVVKSILKDDLMYIWTIIQYPDRGLWFLYALFFISSIVTIVNKYTNNMYIKITVIWCLLTIVTMGIGVKTFGLPFIGYHLAFYTLGFAMKQHNVIEKLRLWMVLLFFLIWCVTGYWCSESAGTQLLACFSSSGTVQHILYRIVSMLVAVFAIIGWFGVFRHYADKKTTVLTYLGRKTLSIYSITLTTEIAILGIIRSWTSIMPYAVEVILLTVFLICFALILGRFLEQNKFTKLLFLGKNN